MENMAPIVYQFRGSANECSFSFQQIESRRSSYLGRPEKTARCVGAGLSIRLNPAVRGCASIF